MYSMEQMSEIAGKLVGNYGRYLSAADQEDVAQEAILAMWQASQNADEDRNPNAYIFTTGKGTILNTIKRIQQHEARHESLSATVEGEEDESTTWADLTAGPDKEGSEILSERERTWAIESAITDLPTVQSAIARRILQEGATLEVAGREQGFSKERARQVLEDAKTALAHALREWA